MAIISISGPGTYTHCVTNNVNGCTTCSAIAVNMATGIKENPDHENYMFANPNNGYFTLSSKNLPLITNLQIYNTLGALIKTQTVNDTNAIVDLRSEPNGIYWIGVGDAAGGSVTFKIIKDEGF